MAEYNGSIELISGITQKGGGTFPLASAKDIQVDDEGTRLDAKLTEVDDKLKNPASSLPDVTTADDGKVLGVSGGVWSAVTPDAGGVSSWNDLTDKPFEDGEHIYIETSNVSTDTTVDMGDGGLVHVTDTALPKSSLIGATVTAHFPDGNSQSTVITEADIVAEYDGGIVLVMMNVVYVWVCYRSGVHTVTVDGETVTIEFPKAGVYTIDFLLSELSAMEFLCPTKCLNAKYLPMDAIKTVVDDYINEALGGDY